MQQAVQLLRVNLQKGLSLAAHTLRHHVHRDFKRGESGALAVAGLQM
jgi:hypothetical protein